MMNALYQTYGRKVVLKFLDASGTSENGTAARADAVKAVEELGAFAVWGGPVLAPAWTEEIKARGVICLGCPAIPDPGPVVFPIVGERRSRPACSSRSTSPRSSVESPRSTPATPPCRPRPESSARSSSTRRAARPSRTPPTSRRQLADGGVDLVAADPVHARSGDVAGAGRRCHPEAQGWGRHDRDLERRSDRTEDLHRRGDQAELLAGVDLRRCCARRHECLRAHLRPEAVGSCVRHQLARRARARPTS